jgi:RHS repeat-associated protein
MQIWVFYPRKKSPLPGRPRLGHKAVLCWNDLYESSIDNNRIYNGKGLQEEFGLDWYDHGARYYDPQLALWHCLDPLSESSTSLSPYACVANNPVNLVDPDGMF